MQQTSQKFENIFNQDFYPTPNSILEQLNFNAVNKTILEPSAGKGNIIEYLNSQGAKEVYYCEINKDLQTVCQSKKATFLKSNFLDLTAEESGMIDIIVMNPPFSEFRKHLLHAWNIAPDGCEIYCIGNTDTINDILSRYNSNQELKPILEDFGIIDNLGAAFENAERKTSVEVSLITLNKPIRSESTNFDDYFDMVDEEEIVNTQEGLIQYNEIDAIVNQYKGVVKNLKSFYDNLEVFKSIVKNNANIDLKIDIQLYYSEKNETPERFLINLQKIFWARIFEKMKIDKYVSSQVKKDINTFIERQKQLPFTKNNIFKMINVIVGTRENTLKRSLETVIDELTKYTHENRYHVEGWKTNEGHLLNKKFISNHYFRVAYNSDYIESNYGRRDEEITDLEKVLCFLSGTNFDDITTIREQVRRFGKLTPNQWYETRFFEYKGFKKGTIHIKFKDMKLWEKLNREYGAIKGNVLPEKL
jgi:hypothetical protein